MTVLLTESFEHESAAGVKAKWGDIGTVSTAPNSSYGRNGKGLLISSVSAFIFQAAAADAHATYIFGAAYRFTAYRGSGDFAMCTFLGDTHTTLHITFCLTSDGKMTIRRGSESGTLLGTSAAQVFALNVWHYVEMKVTISDTVGLAEFRIDGVATPVLTFSGDTKNGGTNTTIDAIEIANNNAASEAHMDDVYLLNGAGSANNNYLGDCIVECLVPTSDGGNTGLTPSTGSSHFALVDESPQNTTDYNASSTGDAIDTYGMSNLATAAGTVYAVQVVNYAQKDIAGSRNVAAVVRQGGTNYAGADKAVGIGFNFYREIWETDPNTAVAWTVSGVNSVEAGAKVR